MRSAAGAIAALSVAIAIGCAPPSTPSAAAARCAYAGAARAAPDGKYRYYVSAAPRGEELCVEVDLPKGGAQRWAPEAPLSPFVRDVALEVGGGFAPVGAAGNVWAVPACGEDRGCRLRYRVLLADAARRLDTFDLAEDHRGVLLAPPSSWVLRPLATHAAFWLAVRTPPGTGFITGLVHIPDGPYVGDIAALDDTPYAAFGAIARSRIELPGAALEIAFAPADPAASARGPIEAWIERAARAVAGYFGRFPIPRAVVIVRIERGRGVGSGHTMGNGGAAILISVGEESTAADFGDDWILVHEMLHLAFPDVRRPWAEEGLATYLEPIIRARAGMTSPDEVWRGLVEGLPNGQPEAEDRGLDETDTWGRRYWGGAMFWLLADLRIRQLTAGRASLDDALRAVSAMGGNVSARWDLDRALAIGDEATGVTVLRPLRAALGGKAERIDLDAIWKALGVSIRGGRVVYDDGAERASIRRAITADPGAAKP